MTVEPLPGAGIGYDVMIALDRSFIQVPLEQARRCLRSEIKLVDKDLAQLDNISSEGLSLEAKSKALIKIQYLIDKFKTSSESFKGRFKSRLTKVNHELSQNRSSYDMTRWLRQRSVRLVADFLLQQGYVNTAEKLINVHGITSEVDMELYRENECIKKSLSNDVATDLLVWCSENRSILKKSKSPLEFLIRRQEFVEMARTRSLNQAIGFSRKHFPAFVDSNEREIEQALGLLAIKPGTPTMPYVWLYDKKRWTDIGGLFERESRLLHGLPDLPQLTSLIHTGLASLKTRECCRSQGFINIDCPACSSSLSAFSTLLPIAHHETSILVCSLTGQLMDADNTPMALPNGYVYSRKALESMADAYGGFVICPKTKKKYRLVEARKCYIS